MKIQKTKNYRIFKKLATNRERNEGHIKKIIESIKKKNLLPERPILVDSNIRVLDGQHRLIAAKRLGLDVYYIISRSAESTDVPLLNSKNLNWKIDDYMNMYTKSRNKNYLALRDACAMYDCPVYLVLAILGDSVDTTTNRTYKSNSFKDGKFIYPENDLFLQRKLGHVSDLARLLSKKIGINRSVYGSILVFIQNEAYEHQRMKNKIKKFPYMIEKCANKKQYLEMLNRIYNRAAKQRIDFIAV